MPICRWRAELRLCTARCAHLLRPCKHTTRHTSCTGKINPVVKSKLSCVGFDTGVAVLLFKHSVLPLRHTCVCVYISVTSFVWHLFTVVTKFVWISVTYKGHGLQPDPNTMFRVILLIYHTWHTEGGGAVPPVLSHTELNTAESTQRSTVTPATPSHCVPVLRPGAVFVQFQCGDVLGFCSVYSEVHRFEST